MKPWVVNIFSAVSLLLCVVIVVLWIRSYGFEDALCYRSNSRHHCIVESQPGRICAEIIYEVSPDGTTAEGEVGFWTYSSPSRDWEWNDYYTRDEFLFRRWGFAVVSGLRLTPNPSSAHPEIYGRIALFPAKAISIPYWFLIILTVIVPFRRVWHTCRRRYWRSRGLCPTCGYDLRASKERCPECGKPIPVREMAK